MKTFRTAEIVEFLAECHRDATLPHYSFDADSAAVLVEAPGVRRRIYERDGRIEALAAWCPAPSPWNFKEAHGVELVLHARPGLPRTRKIKLLAGLIAWMTADAREQGMKSLRIMSQCNKTAVNRLLATNGFNMHQISMEVSYGS
jgi:hypothetical protein